MKFAQALTVSSLVLLSFHARADVAAAQKALDGARAKLTEAVQRIEKDPPSTPDLEAAHAAVEALKTAIDSGAEYEQNDLEYAKAVLAARKEFRTQRAYVDQRRANVHIHEHRRLIDDAAATLTERATRADAKDAGVKEFEDALAAIAALRKLVDESRPFGKEDPKFATYLSEMEATMARREKAIDERATGLLVAKQRGLIDEGKQALTAAMAPLAKTASDAQFKDADNAIAGLTKRLDEGKALEGKDKKYGAEAAKVRGDVAAAKKKMDELWSETGLARLKAEIEPSRKDLQGVARNVRARRPTEDQLAEARTVAIVVRKLIEKFQPEAARSQAFAQYVAEVQVLLVEVEGQLQRRNLEAASAEVNQALKALTKRSPPDEAFDEANSALGILEKTISTINAKDPVMGPYVFDAKALVRDAKASVNARRVEIDVERQKVKVEEERKNTSTLLDALGQPGLSKEKIEATEAGVARLVAVLDAGAPLTKKDREYSAYDREVRKRVTELGTKIAARKVQLQANEGRALLVEKTEWAKVKLEAAKQPDSTDAQLTAAGQAVEALNQAIETQTPMETQDRGYYAQANKARDDFFKLVEGLERAKQVREVRKRTVELFSAGLAAVTAAESADLRTQKSSYEKAIQQFKSCTADGGGMVREYPMLSNVQVLLDGRNSTPKEVLTLCAQQTLATEKLLKDVIPFLAFEEGPKKAYEAAKGFVGKGKKPEAIAQFDECIATGIILGQRNPELKERKFTVAGAETTLSALVATCTGQSKSLRGK
ncbi:MAG: hypothetical protein Q8K32_29715 [Archangium sp.]|nr:hypothetical protein [Archangium sp.]